MTKPIEYTPRPLHTVLLGKIFYNIQFRTLGDEREHISNWNKVNKTAPANAYISQQFVAPMESPSRVFDLINHREDGLI